MTVAGQTRRLLELVDRAERTGSRGDWLARSEPRWTSTGWSVSGCVSSRPRRP
jgi:hypothetical protein